MDTDLQPIRHTVQTNCHISDARHAGDYTLCIYLLKMRELYRWEKGYPFNVTLPGGAVGDWLTERERLWASLEDRPFETIPIGERRFDPFDAEAINRALVPRGLVYSAGLGQRARPHFFLGRLERREDHEGFQVLVAAEELARDLAAPPAMAQGRTVYVRRESLRRLIWEKVEEWRWRRQENAMARAMAFYDFDTSVEDALEAMTDSELTSALWHEVGEVLAGERLGDDWNDMLAQLPRSQAELIARAARDHLADCLSTLPALLEGPRRASLHFYFANLSGMRRELFPSLIAGYERWVDGGALEGLERAIVEGERHWHTVAHTLLHRHRARGAEGLADAGALLEESRL